MNYRVSTVANPRNILYAGPIVRAAAGIVSNFIGPRTLFNLSMELPISLTARVLREPNKPEMVVLESRGVTKKFDRRISRGGQETGEMAVSCDRNGADVPVNSIIIPFRDNTDKQTDRGIVWVIPGDPANADVVFDSRTKTSEANIIAIIAEAEKAVGERVLAHFMADSAT